MRRRTISTLVAAVAVAGAVTLAPGSANAAATITLADWEMNEAPGATTMVDSGPNHLNGTIGSGLSTGVVYKGATGYAWSSTKPQQPPVKPERLVQVPSSTTLNPGARDFAVTIHYATTHTYGNIIQKGQNKTPGGYFKFENPGGYIHCFFKGSITSKVVKSPKPLNDGNWHTIRCEKTAAGLTMTIDGTTTVSAQGNIGTISNTFPLVIGGKVQCNQVSVTCDYFAGNIDWVKLQTS